MDTREDVRQIVPWFSSTEWTDTAKQIYSENPALRVKALDVLRLWRARTDVLPTGVDTTLVLLCALECGRGQQDSVDDLSQRLALSAALTRFLNHALVAGQKDPFSQTMFKRAQGVDLPSWMVKLRHEAAHGRAIPALEPLVEAVTAAVEWLKERYWHQPPLDWNPPEPALDSLIDEWEALSACLQAGIRKTTALPDENLKASNLGIRTVPEAIQRVEGKIITAAVNDPDSLLAAILSSQTFLNPPEGLYGREELPPALIAQWQPLLAVIHSGRLLPALIAKLHVQDKRLASLWIIYLLDIVDKLRTAQRQLRAAGVVIRDVASTAKFVQKRREGQAELEVEARIRQDVGLGPDWPLFVAAPNREEANQLAVDVASKPKKNGRVFLNKILELSDTENSKREKINKLWSIYLGEVQSEPEGDIRSLEDLLQKNPVCEDSDKWIKSSDWDAKAVGILPWQECHVCLDLDLQWE